MYLTRTSLEILLVHKGSGEPGEGGGGEGEGGGDRQIPPKKLQLLVKGAERDSGLRESVNLRLQGSTVWTTTLRGWRRRGVRSPHQ